MASDLPIYLDNHATTRVDPRVIAAMLPCFSERYGNPASSVHPFGWEANAAVGVARRQVATLLGAAPGEVLFTAGATEANNLAIFGVAAAYAHKGAHLVTQATEHKSVLGPCNEWERRGGRVTVLPVDRHGLIAPEAVEAAIGPDTILISIMAANNEIGTLQPLEEIGRIAKQHGVLFHTDAAQAVGKVPVAVQVLGVDLLSLSGHKLYAPKGIGALYVRRRNPRVTLSPQILGGGQEFGLRSGTLNVPGIVALGTACQIALEEMPADAERVMRLRERLHAGLEREFGPLQVNGHPDRRLPNNLNVTFENMSLPGLHACLKRVAASPGSACTSVTPSHVLAAIGLPEERARLSLRFGLGRFTTEAEIDRAVAEMAEQAAGLSV